jgi:16S rRNA processing protein RimM
MESPDILESLEEIFIGAAKDTALPFRIAAVRIREKYTFLDFEEVKDRSSAQALRGFNLFIPSDHRVELEEDEYYWQDIVGLDVITEEGHRIGKIERIIPTGGNDVYVCTGEEREILLPAIEDVIRVVDIEKGVVVVRLLKGL